MLNKPFRRSRCCTQSAGKLATSKSCQVYFELNQCMSQDLAADTDGEQMMHMRPSRKTSEDTKKDWPLSNANCDSMTLSTNHGWNHSSCLATCQIRDLAFEAILPRSKVTFTGAFAALTSTNQHEPARTLSKPLIERPLTCLLWPWSLQSRGTEISPF